MLMASGSADLVNSLGGILAGLSELLLAIGAGIGFVIRSRRNARRERLRTEAAAGLAAQEAKKALEAKLEQQHSAQIEQYKNQVIEANRFNAAQAEQYKAQIRELQVQNRDLLQRLLGEPREHDD